MTKIFISYSHRDKGWVNEWLLPRLERAGLDVHIDVKNFVVGKPTLDNIATEIEQCDYVLLVITKNWIDSEWGKYEATLLHTQEPLNRNGKMLLLVLDDCTIPRTLSIFSYSDFKDEGQREKTLSRLLTQISVKAAASTSNEVLKKVHLAKLPNTRAKLFGREAELAMLFDAWEDKHANVFTLVAWAGVGKTALVNRWLSEMAQGDYYGAEYVLGWSFYSQGMRQERQISSDEFLTRAIRWLGGTDVEEASPWDKGVLLAELIRRRRTLLVLDGLEPLQYPPGEMQGYLRDQGMRALLKELVRFNPGLCVVTTRENIKDIEHTVNGPTKRVILENLSEQAGIQLMRETGITKGSDAELQAAHRYYRGHALTLTLLGRYLAVRYDGDISKRDALVKLTYRKEELGRHAWQAIRSYEVWLSGKAEVAILYLMGLFDRPAEGAAIRELRRKPAILGLTTTLQDLSDEDWQFAVDNLRDLHLLAPKNDAQPDMLDCHPLIREYFSYRLHNIRTFSWKHFYNWIYGQVRPLSAARSSAWQQGHSRLFDYYRNLPAKDYPESIEDMSPLHTAVAHGCRAGRYREALDDVFIKRIRRGYAHFSLFRLGAAEADLSALASFFISDFTGAVAGLDELRSAYVLNETGSALRILGRANEAIEPINRSLQIYSSRVDSQVNAARVARNLSKTYMQGGRLEEAVELARRAINFPGQSEHLVDLYVAYGNLGRALHLVGKVTDARQSFEQSQTLKAEIAAGLSIELPQVNEFTLQEAHHCDLLVEESKTDMAVRLLQSVSQATRKALGLFDYALYHYAYGKALLFQAQKQETDFDAALYHLAEGIENLKRVMRQDELGGAYLVRAALYRMQGNFSLAQQDLSEAREIAERSSIIMLWADYYLEACRLDLAENRPNDSINDLNQAKNHIFKIGYRRRASEVEELNRLLKSLVR